MTNGVTRFLKPAKIASFPKDANLDHIESLLKLFKSWTRELAMVERYKTAYDGKASTLLIHMQVEKEVPADLKDKSLEAGLGHIAEEVLALPTKCFKEIKKDRSNPWKGYMKVGAKPAIPEAVVVAMPHGPMIDFDQKSGVATGLENRSLISLGFKVGTNVAIVEGKTDAGKQFIIKEITSDGSVKMKAITENGSERGAMVKASYQIFMEKYEIDTSVQRKFADWPACDFVESVKFEKLECIADLTKAMCVFYKEFDMKSLQIKVLDKPRSVISDTKHGKGKLIIPVIGNVIRSEERR